MSKSKIAIVVSLAIVLCVFLTLGCTKKTVAPTERTVAQQPQESSQKPQANATTPKAQVEIVAYYPLNPDHKYIADYLKEFEKKYPGKVSVTVYDMQTPEGRKRWQTTGLGCAGVFVNGSTHHEITRNGKKESVDFLKRMDVYWTREDFETVLKDLLKKAEPKPAK